jgi:hypothetical protein
MPLLPDTRWLTIGLGLVVLVAEGIEGQSNVRKTGVHMFLAPRKV